MVDSKRWQLAGEVCHMSGTLKQRTPRGSREAPMTWFRRTKVWSVLRLTDIIKIATENTL